MAYTGGTIGFEVYREMVNGFKMHVLCTTKKVHLLVVLSEVEVVCFHGSISLEMGCPDSLQARASKGNKEGDPGCTGGGCSGVLRG